MREQQHNQFMRQQPMMPGQMNQLRRQNNMVPNLQKAVLQNNTTGLYALSEQVSSAANEVLDWKIDVVLTKCFLVRHSNNKWRNTRRPSKCI
jgi:hypothetical protein